MTNNTALVLVSIDEKPLVGDVLIVDTPYTCVCRQHGLQALTVAWVVTDNGPDPMDGGTGHYVVGCSACLEEIVGHSPVVESASGHNEDPDDPCTGCPAYDCTMCAHANPCDSCVLASCKGATCPQYRD